MLTDEELRSLPDDPELAFIEIVDLMNKWLELAQNNGEPLARERYTNTLLAFADEYDLDLGARKLKLSNYSSWNDYYASFADAVNYGCERLRFRHKLGARGAATTAVELNTARREEIHKLIVKIRKVVAVLQVSETKRDAIYARLAALTREVDQSRTRFGTLMALVLEGSSTLGEAAKNLEPVAKLVGKITSIVADQKAEADQRALPKPPETKRIAGPDDKPESYPINRSDLDDEIPF